MLNKRVKEGIKKVRKPGVKLKFSLGTFAVAGLCMTLLIIATFTAIKISFNIPSETGVSSVLKFEYIPQIPVVLFIAALLGDLWGLFTILLYVIAGLTPYFPIFGLGGGPGYIFQYNFGYIFGYIPAIIITSNRMNKSRSFWNTIFAALLGILTIHITGVAYMTVIALLRHDSWEFIGNMAYYQSVSKIMYDVVFGVIAALIGRGCRKLLWPITG